MPPVAMPVDPSAPGAVEPLEAEGAEPPDDSPSAEGAIPSEVEEGGTAGGGRAAGGAPAEAVEDVSGVEVSAAVSIGNAAAGGVGPMPT